ncbi:DUF2827 domain-containing protein [Paraherbaspirillum soli]|uniref:DUF2827 domain-containing protein n=1 Tax=Paraherbaspirillum soli TaxID=631222 RepID=A0ABW0M5W8_9BURK
MKKINVGISVFAVQGAQLWSNGINQNLAFLVLLLQSSPQVGRVFLLNGGNLDHIPVEMGFDGLDAPLVKPQDVTHELDVVIEMGAQLPLEWLLHVRALGVKIITFFVGHTYADNAESPMFDGPSGQIFNGTPWHEIWTLPHHMKASGPLLRTVSRVPVCAMPHIWSPLFIQRQIDQVEQDGHRFGYQPNAKPNAGENRRGWRTAIFEPNISVVKSCFIPMLVCEQAFRLEPQSVSTMMVMNTLQMKEHPTFNRFAINLDLTQQSKATYEPRVAFVECMAVHKMDAVVSHQWECEMNYLYYDALYGGYPLIHNSDYLKAAGVGIHYPDFEASAGGRALLDAWHKEPDFWDDYKRAGAAFLGDLSPTHPANVEAFVKRLQHTVEGQA